MVAVVALLLLLLLLLLMMMVMVVVVRVPLPLLLLVVCECVYGGGQVCMWARFACGPGRRTCTQVMHDGGGGCYRFHASLLPYLYAEVTVVLTNQGGA